MQQGICTVAGAAQSRIETRSTLTFAQAEAHDAINHEPWQKLDNVTDGIVDHLRRRRDPLADPRFQRLVRHLHALGPRPVGEFLIELVANDPDMVAAVQVNLERYHHLNTATVRALDCDQWPAPPIHEVQE